MTAPRKKSPRKSTRRDYNERRRETLNTFALNALGAVESITGAGQVERQCASQRVIKTSDVPAQFHGMYVGVRISSYLDVTEISADLPGHIRSHLKESGHPTWANEFFVNSRGTFQLVRYQSQWHLRKKID